MKLETGYVYHIKNDFFTFANDNKLMTNHEGTATRPNYFCIKREDKVDDVWKNGTVLSFLFSVFL